ncbi:MAG TPA: cytochrome c [Myxococcota bacterium]|nr:cytochrome c [Myxococcota bacterium]
MNRHSLALCSALAALCSAAPVWAQSSEEKTAAAGREAYLRYCASCHGTEGKGNGPLAEDLRVAPADLTQISAHRGGVFPQAMIAEFIDGRRRVRAHGPANMPVWGERFDREVPTSPSGDIVIRSRVMLLIEYLRSIQAK